MADGPQYISGRVFKSFSLGINPNRHQRLDARAPIAELVEALNAFRPEAITAYASIAALLAEEQLAGRLRISPQIVATGAEVRTPEMEERIVAAWGQAPFNSYGTTETGPGLGIDCDRHDGLHVFEDLTHIEVVDDENRPVAAGEPGSRLLVTNLFNRTQPLIRYEISDLVTLSPEPCPCGRPFALLASVDGRNDDILELPATAGGTVSVHPFALGRPLSRIAELVEYRIVYARDTLRIEAVLNGDPQGVQEAISTRLGDALAARGVKTPPIQVESVTQIPRHPQSGKRKLIEMR
jgi:phenylacetate-coenzyme A ligase PaaK-like adenylate-forming protein